MKEYSKILEYGNNNRGTRNDVEKRSCYDNISIETTSKISNADTANDMYFTVEKPTDVLPQVTGFDTSWMILDGKKYAESSSNNTSVGLNSSSYEVERKIQTRQSFECYSSKKLRVYIMFFMIIAVSVIIFSITLGLLHY